MAIIESKCKESSFARTIWCVTPDLGTPIDDLLKPEYWAHVARNFAPTHRIEVTAEDNSYFAELCVVDAGHQWAKVELLRKHEFGANAVVGTDTGEFQAKWRGARKWSVERKSDKTILAEDLGTKEDALLWIATHSRQMAA